MSALRKQAERSRPAWKAGRTFKAVLDLLARTYHKNITMAKLPFQLGSDVEGSLGKGTNLWHIVRTRRDQEEGPHALAS